MSTLPNDRMFVSTDQTPGLPVTVGLTQASPSACSQVSPVLGSKRTARCRPESHVAAKNSLLPVSNGLVVGVRSTQDCRSVSNTRPSAAEKIRIRPLTASYESCGMAVAPNTGDEKVGCAGATAPA